MPRCTKFKYPGGFITGNALIFTLRVLPETEIPLYRMSLSLATSCFNKLFAQLGFHGPANDVMRKRGACSPEVDQALNRPDLLPRAFREQQPICARRNAQILRQMIFQEENTLQSMIHTKVTVVARRKSTYPSYLPRFRGVWSNVLASDGTQWNSGAISMF